MQLDNMKLQYNHDGTYRCSGTTNLIDNDGNECGKLYVDAYRCTISDDLSDLQGRNRSNRKNAGTSKTDK